ncbi:MAG: acyl-ACP--UDP-N-acetylglucosamine O-acyltransferase, partial [Phycisphaerae bacterium]|nr:acyl-ACP--UDP-N-acetylglucosamine O-acyltransferase [Phycisphaerae bacterium]
MPEISVVREIAPSARIAPEVEIGLYCVIGPNVTIGAGTILVRRVSVTGNTTIGSGNRFEEGCVLGSEPQDLKYAGGQTLLIIGHRNHFAQDVTIHPGTELGGYLTRIGDDNVLMDGCHVAHDCYVDDRTRLGHNVLLAGHIHVQTGAVVDGLCGLHHFVTIGRYAHVGPATPVRRDVPPFTCFCRIDNHESHPVIKGIHEEGIRSANLNSDEEKDLRRALSELFEDESALQTKIEQLVNLGVEGEAAELCRFCQRSLQGVYGRYRELYRGE